MVGRKDFDLCPKWEKCNSPVCPLDPDWEKRKMLDNDSVCYYQTESVKDNAHATFERRGLSCLYAVITKATPPICARWPRIRRALERATSYGSRLGQVAPWEKI